VIRWREGRRENRMIMRIGKGTTTEQEAVRPQAVFVPEIFVRAKPASSRGNSR